MMAFWRRQDYTFEMDPKQTSKGPSAEKLRKARDAGFVAAVSQLPKKRRDWLISRCAELDAQRSALLSDYRDKLDFPTSDLRSALWAPDCRAQMYSRTPWQIAPGKSVLID